MRFVLHVGTHKTGTTSIQETCAFNRDRLKARGLIYPDLRSIGGLFRERHHDFAAAFSSSPRKRPKVQKIEKLVRTLGEKADGTVLFSAESIYRHVLGDDSEDFWTGHARYLARLAELFEGHSVEPVVVFRRHDTFAESLYQENVKSRGYGESFQTFLCEFNHFFEYRRHTEALIDAFGGVRVMCFEGLGKSDLTAEFLKSLGVEPGDLQAVERKNISPSTQLVLYLRNVNPMLERKAQRGLSKFIVSRAKELGAGLERINFFDPDERQAFRQKYADDETWLANYAGLTESRFFPDKDIDRPGRTSLTDEERATITARLLNSTFAMPESRPGRLRRLFGKR